MQAGNLHAVEPRDVAVVRLDLQRAGAEQRGVCHPELAPDVDGRVAVFHVAQLRAALDILVVVEREFAARP